jgi:hypothetical protein
MRPQLFGHVIECYGFLEEGKALKMLNKRDVARNIAFVKLSKDLIVLSNDVIVKLMDYG